MGHAQAEISRKGFILAARNCGTAYDKGGRHIFSLAGTMSNPHT
jgi:hypothetical protein